jgi:hypothetical protein
MGMTKLKSIKAKIKLILPPIKFPIEAATYFLGMHDFDVILNPFQIYPQTWLKRRSWDRQNLFVINGLVL